MDNLLDMMAGLALGPNPEYIVQKRRRMPGGFSVPISNLRFFLSVVGPEAPHDDPHNPAKHYGDCYVCSRQGEMKRWEDQGGAPWGSFECKNPGCRHCGDVKFWSSVQGDSGVFGKVLCRLVWE
jgi:hypothetical protein